MDWMRAGAALYGFRVGASIATIAVISGMDARYEWGFREYVADASGIPYEDIDFSLTLLDYALIVLIFGLGARTHKKLRANMKKEGAEYREVRDEQKKSK